MIYLHLLMVFAGIGIFGFGGGMAMLPMIYQSAQAFNLMSAEEFSDLVAISQVTPGPIAINAATYVGYHCAGVAGAAVATLGVAFPSFVMVMLVCGFISRFQERGPVQGALSGIRPVTAGLVGAAAIFMAQSLGNSIEPTALVILTGTVILMSKTKIGPIPIVLAAGVLGAFFCR